MPENWNLQRGQVVVDLDGSRLKPCLGLRAHQHRRNVGLKGDGPNTAVAEAIEGDLPDHAAFGTCLSERARADRTR